MKATLTFDLPEEQHEHLAAVHGMEFCTILWDLDQEFRGWLKHGGAPFTTADGAMEYVRKIINEEVANRGLTAVFEGG